MAGIKLVTDLEPDKALQIAWRAAQDQGFRLTTIENYAFTARKGQMLLNMIAGALAPYSLFQVSAKKYEDGTTDVVLENNSPRVTSGRIGAGRVQRQMDELVDKVAAALQQGGGKVVSRKEI